MQTLREQKHYSIRDSKARRLVSAVANPKSETLPVVIQRENDLVNLDALWRSKVQKKISELVRDARYHHTLWLRHRHERTPSVAVRGLQFPDIQYSKAKAFMAAARRLKGLL